MSLRFGLLDLVGVIVVTLVLLMPVATRRIEPLYLRREHLDTDALALAQAEAIASPHDSDALLRYVNQLSVAQQTDLALRFAGARSSESNPDPVDRWQAILAVASIHADRLDAKATYDWTAKGLAQCNADPEACPAHEQVRIELYLSALKEAIDQGLDPRLDPVAFRAAIEAAIPTVHVGGPRHRPPQSLDPGIPPK
jgi:hypothetical protein